MVEPMVEPIVEPIVPFGPVEPDGPAIEVCNPVQPNGQIALIRSDQVGRTSLRQSASRTQRRMQSNVIQ
ncbi:unnamed protein product [Protopolystoma xenopodis]|uniref:Uncharacterized protein n=1 Tax=Protopolystoma xenopodis TaxID=117903 RepID=A0A448XK15_9PLAT|nr:unnamed protein product [Protopolystoma xenopodis]